MIKYNPKDWFTFIFRIHKADTIRMLASMILSIAIYTAVICVLEVEIFKLSEKSYVKNLTTMHQLLGIVISMLLVFRTNTAYDRWWEGRKLWGSLVNNSRNLAMKINSFIPSELTAEKSFFMKAIPTYAYTLSTHLINPKLSEELFDDEELTNVLVNIDTTKHLPNQVAKTLFEKTNDLYTKKIIDGNQLIILNEELKSYTDICGACERIKNTPIPFSYSLFIKKFIFFYVMTLPFGLVFTLGYISIPVVVFIFYVLASLELIAEEIEEPFGEDSNDLPTLKISKNIEKHVGEILG